MGAFLPIVASLLAPMASKLVGSVLKKTFNIGSGVINGGWIAGNEIRKVKRTDINPYVDKIFEKLYESLKKQGAIRRKSDVMKYKTQFKKMMYARIPIEVEKKGGLVYLPGEL